MSNTPSSHAEMRRIAEQFLRFCITGAASAAIDLGALALLLHLGQPRRPALAIAFIFGVLLNYTLHRYFTFRIREPASLSEFMRYSLVVALNLLLTVGTVELLVWLVNPDVLLAKLVAIPLVTANGFFLSKVFIFRRAAHGDCQDVRRT